MDWKKLLEAPVAKTEARHEGHCPVCEEPIDPGDMILKWDDDEPWVCEDC